MTFDDLKFESRFREFGPDDVQAKVFFPNGYGASVVRGKGTYGSAAGLYELAVLKGGADSWGLTYETPVTNDVEGYLTPDDVTRLLGEIAALPNAGGDK